MRSLPEQAYLKECFDYDPNTGTLTWRRRPIKHFEHLPAESIDRIWKSFNARFAGKQISRPGRDGYALINFIWVGPVGTHRIIWKWMTGDDPFEIDHRDRDRLNNRWDNLRLATKSQNQRNRGVMTGRRLPKGVTKQPKASSYFARIKFDGKQLYLGTFRTAGEAHDAYCAAAREYFGEFWCSGQPHSSGLRGP